MESDAEENQWGEGIVDTDEDNDIKLLVLEPLYGGSHKKLIDIVLKHVPQKRYTLITMPPKRWNWRARTSAVFLSDNIPKKHTYQLLFCSSVLPLSELLGLRPDLAPLFKILYFHENHLEMTMNASRDLKYQLGLNEIMSCLAADQVLFNSYFNRDSFLKSVNNHMEKHLDLSFNHNMEKEIESKSEVVHFPLDLNGIDLILRGIHKFPRVSLYIVWPHRWEFDRPPQMFYRVIRRLENAGYQFRVVMFPESFTGKPTDPDLLIEQYRSPRLLHLEDAESNLQAYYTILKRADVIVSTAQCEFFPTQILEGMYCDLIPVLPRLPVYEELFHNTVREIYETEDELYHILADLCRRKHAGVLNKTYKQLTTSYESTKWFEKLLKAIDCQLV